MTRRLPEHTRANARVLRRNLTDAEARLWTILRRRGLESHKFRRQHPFGPYILDLYCAEGRLVVEVDGGQHFGADAGHYDAERTAFLEAVGLRILRFTNLEVLQETESVLEQILGALKPLSLTLSPRGRGDEGLLAGNDVVGPDNG
jgi:very-short-patch-repair endonuclease